MHADFALIDACKGDFAPGFLNLKQKSTPIGPSTFYCAARQTSKPTQSGRKVDRKKNSTHRAALSVAITRIAQVTAALKQQPAIAAADPALPSPAARDACYATALITRYRRLQQPLRLCILHNQQPPTASTCSSSAHASTSSPSATPPQPSHTRQHTPASTSPASFATHPLTRYPPSLTPMPHIPCTATPLARYSYSSPARTLRASTLAAPDTRAPRGRQGD